MSRISAALASAPFVRKPASALSTASAVDPAPNPVSSPVAHAAINRAVSHLSDEAVAAFADGVLRDGARARAEQHLGACAECREAVRGQRVASAVLRAAPLPCLPTGLADRLRNLPGTTPLPASAFSPAALTSESQPMFAAFHTVVAQAGPPAAPADPTTYQAHQTHRRSVAGTSFSALALSAVAVSLLASTAATAGGATTTRPIPAPTVSSTPGGAIDVVNGISGGTVDGGSRSSVAGGLTPIGQLDLTGSP